MAQTTRVVLTCDWPGHEGIEAAGTVIMAFDHDGSSREADLCQECIDELQAVGREISSAPRRATRIVAPRKRASKRTSARRRRRTSPVDNAELRQWAKSNGYTIGDRGRIPASVRDAYKEAQPA